MLLDSEIRTPNAEDMQIIERNEVGILRWMNHDSVYVRDRIERKGRNKRTALVCSFD